MNITFLDLIVIAVITAIATAILEKLLRLNQKMPELAYDVSALIIGILIFIGLYQLLILIRRPRK